MTSRSNPNGPLGGTTILLDQVAHDRQRRAATSARSAGPLSLTIAADVVGQIRPAPAGRATTVTTRSVAGWAKHLTRSAAGLRA
ncbi:MAG TPA: hypothetical protein VF796_04210 [Humisphaera sp.]